MADLRKDKRAPASLKVKYRSATVEQFIEQFGTDVSSGGIFVKTKTPIATGSLLKLELQLSDASPVIHGVGRVCWRREPGPDPGLPAGMGIKFIKLDPGSRTIVDRIVQTRGARPSRFDQTEGAEVAPPSVAPEAPDLSPPPQRVPAKSAIAAKPAPAAPPAQSPVAKPAGTSAAAAPPRPFAYQPAARSGAAKPGAGDPAVRGSSPGAAAVAGLFADSPLARGSAPEATPPKRDRSSFFPPDNGAQDAASPPPGALPPPAFGAAAKADSAARDEQARQSGAFLAAALAQGGVAEPATTPPPPRAKGEDELIDQLFADVMQSPSRAASAPADPSSVEDMFAALSEEEGLSSPGNQLAAPSAAGADRASPPGRASQPGHASHPGRARPPAPSQADDEGVDELFSALDASRRPAAPPAARGLRQPPPAVDPREDEWDGPTHDLEETDLAGASIPPSAFPSPPSEPAPAPSLGLAVAPPQPARARSPLVWILPLLIAAAGGGYFYYQRTLSPPPVTVDRAPFAPASAPAEPVAAAGASAAVEPVAGAAAAAPATAARAQGGAAAIAEGLPGAAAPGAGENAAVEITSLPRGAEVKVDGKVVGVTPLHMPLAAGKEARVTVSSEGYAEMTKSVVPAEDAEPLRFKLEPLPYELRVRTEPPAAELSVEGKTALAPGPLVLGHLDGSVQVSVAKPGYQRMTRPVRLDEFREVDGVMRADIEVRLSPLPGGAVQAPARESRSSRRRSGSASAVPPSPPAPSEPVPEAAPSEPAPSEPAPPAPTPPPPRELTPMPEPSPF